MYMEHISKAHIKRIRSLQQKKFRDELGLFVAEGDKCINELREAFALEALVSRDNATDLEIAQMSSLRTPQGTLAVFRQKHYGNEMPQGALSLVLDGVQDPGNLGTILRTADWFGISDVYCSFLTADCYSPKVVQSTMGALARVRVHYVDVPLWIDEWKTANPNGNVYGTLLDGKNMYLPEAVPDKKHGLVIMGNEGNGISTAVRERITHPIFIPKMEAGGGESLNVAIATAIVLAEFCRMG